VVDGSSFPDCPAQNSEVVPYSPNVTRTQSVGLFSYGVAAVRLDPQKEEALILSNGQDLAPQPLVAIPAQSNKWPIWYSASFDFQGRLAIGDIDGNGYPEIAVPVFADRARNYSGGELQIYGNQSGQLSPTVAQRIPIGGATLEAAFGDADADGDLDLATSVLGTTGLLPGPPPSGSGPTLIFRNQQGKLESRPFWTSASVGKCPSNETLQCNFVFRLLFADVNQDGIMDLVANGNHLRIYQGRLVGAGTPEERTEISTTHSWQSKATWDVGYDVSMAWRDRESRSVMLAVSSYSPTQGTYPFRIYSPAEGDTAIWESKVHGLGGGLLLQDVDGDDHADLITASQGVNKQPVRIFLNSEAGFDSSPQFCSGSTSASSPRTILCGQSLFFGGTVVSAQGQNQSKLTCEVFSIGKPPTPPPDTACETTVLPGTHAGYVFTLGRKASQIQSVRIGGETLNRDQIAFTPNSMTVSLGRKVLPAQTLEIVYKYLVQPNIVVADMDPLCGPGTFQYQD
jgi:hypothetical protein